MPALFDQRANRLHRTFHDAAHGDPFLAKLNPAGGDAGDFQQVIHEMFQLPQLTFDDAAGLLLDRGSRSLLETEQLHGVGDGGERVAQFVAEHRQELVLAVIGLLECLQDYIQFFMVALRREVGDEESDRSSAVRRKVSRVRNTGTSLPSAFRR